MKFIWLVKGKEVEREPARNCYAHELHTKKLEIAVKHGCTQTDVEMQYVKEPQQF